MVEGNNIKGSASRAFLEGYAGQQNRESPSIIRRNGKFRKLASKFSTQFNCLTARASSFPTNAS